MPASDPMAGFLRHLAGSMQQDTLVRLLLTSPVAGNGVERITGRLAEIKEGRVLSLTVREARRDTTRNLTLNEVEAWFRANVPACFTGALLETTVKNWQLTTGKGGDLRLVSHPAATKITPKREHDRARATWLDASAQPWLQALGICDERGKIKASMADKHRQIDRYLEIFSHLLRDCGWVAEEGRPSEIGSVEHPPLTIVDMGCGKGYLTFGVWHLLNRALGIPANVIGVEARADLVVQTNIVAEAVDARTLCFNEGAIADTKLPALDALIALHACNTATDDAIRRGLELEAKLIVVSPCCHQELRPKLGRPEPFAALLKHGLMAERFSEWLTDGLRTLHLEAAGYATKVVEFVASEHTPRNLLIAGVRREHGARDEQAREAARRLKEFFGIGPLAMDPAAS